MVEICIYVFKNQYGNGFIVCKLLLRIMENLHLTEKHMQFPFHIFLLKIQPPFLKILKLILPPRQSVKKGKKRKRLTPLK